MTKEEIVKKILLTPIKCLEHRKDDPIIYLKDNVIYSTQLYKYLLDPDMSDFSVGFYKIVYKNILEENAEILNKNGTCKNKNYMGDTMHSFNILANVILHVNSKKNRPPEKEWPSELKCYSHHYHCLANFWIIPMCHGRNSKKLSSYDSLDYYLNKVYDFYLNKEKKYRYETDEYFKNKKFTSYESFLEIHGMSGYETLDTSEISEIYSPKDKCFKEIQRKGLEEIGRIRSLWDERAREIAEKHTEELYDYFDGLGLINVAETTN